MEDKEESKETLCKKRKFNEIDQTKDGNEKLDILQEYEIFELEEMHMQGDITQKELR